MYRLLPVILVPCVWKFDGVVYMIFFGLECSIRVGAPAPCSAVGTWPFLSHVMIAWVRLAGALRRLGSKRRAAVDVMNANGSGNARGAFAPTDDGYSIQNPQKS